MNRSSYKSLLVAVFILILFKASAQVSLSLVITDNLVTNSFGFDPPKPASPKKDFTLQGNKGAQVIFYFNANGTGSLPKEGYRVRLIAYHDNGNTDDWKNEMTYVLKKGDKYGIVAMNFFDPGQYKIVLSDNSDKSKVLADGTFNIEKK